VGVTGQRVPFQRVLVAAAVIVAAGLAARVVHTRVASVARGSGTENSAAGRQRRWSVLLETRISQPGAADDRATTITLRGDWVSTVSGESASGYDVAYELEGAHAEGTGLGDVRAADVAQLEHHLAERFWVTYQPDGAATRVHFPKDMTDDVRNFLELVATQVQLVRPAAAQRQWTATERDAAGTYFAAYDDLGAGAILKRKMRYVTLDGTAGPGDSTVAVRVDASEVRFSVDAAGLVDTVAGSEATHVDAKLGALGLNVDIRIRLDHPRSTRAPDLIGSFEGAKPGLDSGPIATQRASDEEMQARHDARLLYGVTITDVLDTVHSGHADDKTRERLEAFMRQHPGDIPRALTFVRAADHDQAATVLQALGAGGTPPAQDAICTVASDDRAPTPLRTEALAALVRTKQPTASTVATLLRLMDAPDPALRRQALYMTGTAGNASATRDPQTTARIETDLLARWDRCSAQTCVDVLAALGNLATPAIVPAVEHALADGNPSVRAAAVSALRRVKVPSADPFIAAAMTGDKDPSVRAAAVFAATFRPVGPLLEALSHAIETDAADYVRSAAIEAVAGHIDESPLVEKALASAAAKDPVAGVRRLASQALESGRP